MALARSDAELARYTVRKWYADIGHHDPDPGGLDTHAKNILDPNIGLEMAYVGFLDSPEMQAWLAKERATG